MSSKGNIFLYTKEKGIMAFGKERLPEFKEVQSIEWILFGDEDGWKNQYPQYVDSLSKTSSKNGAILKAKKRHVYGKGLVLDESDLTGTEQIPAKVYISEIKKSKVHENTVKDFVKFNGFAVEIIFDKAGKKFFPHYLPFKNIRKSKKEYDKEGKELPRKYYYTSDWSKSGKQPSQNKDFVTFHPFTWDEKMDKSKRYIVYYNGDEEEYPVPDYVGGIPYISADAEVGNYVKNVTLNGFTGAYIINFYNGEPSADQKKAYSEMFDKAFSGTDNAGKSLKVYNENSEKGVEATPIGDNGESDKFINLNKQITGEVFIAHCTPESAVEIPPSAGGLTNNADQERVSIEKWTEAWVIPNMEPFNEFYNSVFEYNKIKGKVYVQRLDPIKPQLPIERLFEIGSKTELRKIYREAGWDLSEENDEQAQVMNAIKELNIKFSKEDDSKIIELFEACGTEDEGCEMISTSSLFGKDIFSARKQAETMAFEFASKLEDAVLNLLNDNPNLTNKEIGERLNETPKTINSVVKSLTSKSLISDRTPTQEGEDKATENEIISVYKYALRDDAPKLEKGGKSRDFCKELMRLSTTRSWSIEDIQNISNQVGYDVFSRRGGWYHNPNTDRNTPFCRHVWEVSLKRKK